MITLKPFSQANFEKFISLVSDYLKANGWTVYHIMEIEKSTKHTYTKPAKVIDGKVSYEEMTLL